MSLHDSRSPRLSRMLWLSWVVFSLFLTLASANNSPKFNMNSTFMLPEDTPIGTLVFQLVAEDVENDTLYYSIGGENAYYFSLDSRTGNVMLKQSVDYEQTKVILLNVEVTDKITLPTSKKITIIINDRNDNKPIFQNEPYLIDVLENTTIGTPIYDVRAVDIDSENAGQVSYKIIEVIPNNAENRQLFYILQNGTVVLNGSLSYNNKSTFYRIKIFATDNGGLWNGFLIYQNNTAYISVTVIDVPDLDPEFLGEPYVASVSENCPLGTPIMTVLAIDKDKDVNDIILYSLINASNLFTVNQTTGVITVSSDLDREGVPGEEVQFQIVAQEKNLNIYHQVVQVTSQVTIHITDINDHKPQFYLCTGPPCNFTGPTEVNVSGQIEEHASARTSVANLSIVAYDPDKGENGTFQLFLRGPDALAFSVSPRQIVNEGTVQVLVRNSSLVDYETRTTMSVEIVANDTRRTVDCCSFATVTIHLLDINDHRPEFRQTDYKLFVLEESPPGFIVASNITATDPDSGKFGEITYQLLPKNIQSDFTVNSMNGTIFVANGSKINWGMRNVYYATLQAMDGDGLIGSTQLEITVIDINNNRPVVIGSYNFMVIDGNTIEPFRIEANDQDKPETNNSYLHYEIMPSNFSINFTINPDTGDVVSKGPLDREAIPVELNGKIVVTILVEDLGIPQLNTTVNVTITVEDKNDNAPSFSSSNYEFSVYEDLQGALVGVVEARDADQTQIHNRISFYINSSTGSNNFLIRSRAQGSGWYQGMLSLDPESVLDYDKMQEKFYNLILRAENSDLGETVEAAIAMVRVYVLDVNDESPTIVPFPPENIHITENEKLHTLVAELEATDKDTNHSLVFQELAVACFNSTGSVGNICHHWFHLVANGSLFVTSSDIDYELCTQVEITLRVKDEFTAVGNPYSRNETLVILIDDANDNAPQFYPVNDTFVIIPELSPVDLSVAEVKAKDADSGENGVITFSISEIVFIQDKEDEQKFPGVFKVAKTMEKDISMGIIRIASSLNSMLEGQYRVKVEAKDNGTQALSNFMSLDLFSVAKSYRIKLKFGIALKELQDNSNDIKRILSKATGTTVYIAAIYTDDSSTSKSERAPEKTAMDAYFVYKNGTALTDEHVLMLIRRNPEQLEQLTSLGLSVIGPADVKEPKKDMELFGIIIGLTAAVFILLLILTGTVIGMRKSYTRKLKALKALKVASHFSANEVQQGPAIPGTNKYNAEGANPVLGFSLDPSMNFEENASSEVASLNSLDENMVDAAHDLFPAKLKLDKTDAQQEINNWEEPLKAALDSHRKYKPLQQGNFKQAPLDFGNSSLNTTEM
ncbi:cadherin-related family member 2 isoform X1 [Pantherophis guttatus]|uniref:Cadherin-related family member 2 isoform X1 n=2 Tax=Pantherophis guttatus TaxID=94885 RepID=A0A6P9DSQ4_PANGU|nr:cadherin-related family member 2 isoform X1 [Pantherophis guttatus]XP_034298724.1 cadherin-related family member 2 isoform X1 [Pantherophis guttatus]